MIAAFSRDSKANVGIVESWKHTLSGIRPTPSTTDWLAL